MEPKPKQEVIEKVFPFVTDFNPGLPNIGGILNKNKHIINLDSDLVRVINPDNIFASYRGTNTIKNLLIHSKLPKLNEDIILEDTLNDGR